MNYHCIKNVTHFCVLLFLTILATLYSCKKGDSDLLLNPQKEDGGVSRGLPQYNKQIQKVKRSYELKNIDKPFKEEYGIPLWNKAILSQSKGEPGKSDPLRVDQIADTIVIIPIKDFNQNQINAYLLARVNDSVILSVHTAAAYTSMNLSNSGQTYSAAEKHALKFMLLNRHVFGFNKHEIIDKRLFQSANALFDTAGITRYITIDGPDSNTISARTYYQTCNDFPVSVVDLHCTGHCKPKLAFRTTASAAYTCDECSACATITQDILTVCTGWWDEDDIGGGGGGTEPGEGGGSGGDNPPDPGDPCAGGRIIGARLPAGCGGGGGSAGGGGGWIPVVPDEDKVDENGFYASRKAELTALLENDPAALLPCDEIANMETYGAPWQNVASFQLPQNLKDRLHSLPSAFTDAFSQQTLDNARGPIVNCDYYPIRIQSLPNGFSQESLLEYFRININQFITPSTGVRFTPYKSCWQPTAGGSPICPVDDTDLFNSAFENSVGAVLHINIIGDKAAVILSDYFSHTQPTYLNNVTQFMFTTIKTPITGRHPVAGNRAFGVFNSQSNPSEFTFYTVGVDRLWTNADRFFNALGGDAIFDGGDDIWTDVQNNFKNWINSLPGGQATNYTPNKIISRPEWNDVKKFLKKEINYQDLKIALGC